MSKASLRVSIGQYSVKGRKETNQDFHGALVPEEPLLSSKGAAIAIADGISTSEVSHLAAEMAVKSFLTDYFCTSEAWTVKKSVHRVLAAANSWLHAQTQRSQYRYDKDKGYVCTLSAAVVRSATAHLFHVGDSRIYQVQGNALEQLTNDHRVVVSSEQSYLSRAMGINAQLEIDYREVRVTEGDVFLLATDGVYDFIESTFAARTIRENADDLDRAARLLVEEAFRQGSGDNLTAQLLRIDQLPKGEAGEVADQAEALPLPPLLDARMVFDGYRILRQMHASSRSHIYLAQDVETSETVVLKLPSIDLRGDPAYLRRFLMEEWVARRVSSAHVLKPCAQTRRRNYLYVAMEYVEGQTLAQFLIDNPRPGLETIRDVVEQVAKGLRAFHRMEMIHQDLRPENIMIDAQGTVKIIDFGSTRVAGVAEVAPSGGDEEILGTLSYTAPEYFLGEGGTARSDLYSLGVIAYQMLTGRLPYGTQVPQARTRAAQRRLTYHTALDDEREIPAWIDAVLQKAVHPDPFKRYEELSEFTFDLRNAGKTGVPGRTVPLMERNPLLFWKLLTLALALVNLGLLARLLR